MKIIVDHAQKRLYPEYLEVQTTSAEMDAQSAYADGNTILDPVNQMLILKPYRFDSDWYSSNSGNYTKLALTDFTVVSGQWVQQEIPSVAAGPWVGMAVTSSNTAGGELKTSSTYEAGRGFSFSCFNYGGNESSSTTPIIQVGWGTGLTWSPAYFNIYGDGSVDFYRDHELYKTGSISAYTQDATNAQQKNTGKNSYSFFDFIALPYNANQILVWSLNGGSFAIEYDDLDTDFDAANTITPSGAMFVKVPSGRTGKFQMAPLKFPTSGTAYSKQLSFVEPPRSGALRGTYNMGSFVGIQSYACLGYAPLVGTGACDITLKTTSNGTFTPDGTTKDCLMKLAITNSSANSTPTIFGGFSGYNGLIQSTPDEEVDITQWVQSCTLDQPEQGYPATLNLKIVEVKLASDEVPQLTWGMWRPIKILDDNDTVIFDGIITDIVTDTHGGRTVSDVTAQDKTAILDQSIFRDRMSFVGATVAQVFKFLAQRAGIAATWYGGDTRLPVVSSPQFEDWGENIKVGDTAKNVMQKIMDTYAGTYIYGAFPDNVYKAGPKSHFSNIYDGLAVSMGVASANGLATTQVFYNINQKMLIPEANDIRVTGQNPRTKELFQVWREDTAAQDPTLAVSSRPDNWVGHKLVYGIIDPMVTSIGIASEACDFLYERLNKKRYLLEFESRPIGFGTIPVWIGDQIKLYGVNKLGVSTLSTATTRVTALRYEWLKDDYARVTYTTEVE